MSTFKNNIPQVWTKIERGQKFGLKAAGHTMSTAIKGFLSISTPPSSPGQPPAVRSGSLRRSVATDESGLNNATPSVRVGLDTSTAGPGKTPPALYGQFLEYGAAAGRRRAFRLPDGQWRIRKNPMLPRPFMRPKMNDKQVHSDMAAAFAAQMKESIK